MIEGFVEWFVDLGKELVENKIMTWGNGARTRGRTSYFGGNNEGQRLSEGERGKKLSKWFIISDFFFF